MEKDKKSGGSPVALPPFRARFVALTGLRTLGTVEILSFHRPLFCELFMYHTYNRSYHPLRRPVGRMQTLWNPSSTRLQTKTVSTTLWAFLDAVHTLLSEPGREEGGLGKPRSRPVVLGRNDRRRARRTIHSLYLKPHHNEPFPRVPSVCYELTLVSSRSLCSIIAETDSTTMASRVSRHDRDRGIEENYTSEESDPGLGKSCAIKSADPARGKRTLGVKSDRTPRTARLCHLRAPVSPVCQRRFKMPQIVRNYARILFESRHVLDEN